MKMSFLMRAAFALCCLVFITGCPAIGNYSGKDAAKLTHYTTNGDIDFLFGAGTSVTFEVLYVDGKRIFTTGLLNSLSADLKIAPGKHDIGARFSAFDSSGNFYLPVFTLSVTNFEPSNRYRFGFRPARTTMLDFSTTFSRPIYIWLEDRTQGTNSKQVRILQRWKYSPAEGTLTELFNGGLE